MKYFRLIIVAAISISLLSCNGVSSQDEETKLINNPASAEQAENSKMPKLVLEKDVHDFGNVVKGEIVKYTFRFTNEGDADLILSNVKSSCGCTVPKFSSEPIAPGEKGSVEVEFNSSRGQIGFNNKTITLLTNTSPNTYVLRIKANVKI